MGAQANNCSIRIAERLDVSRTLEEGVKSVTRKLPDQYSYLSNSVSSIQKMVLRTSLEEPCENFTLVYFTDVS